MLYIIYDKWCPSLICIYCLGIVFVFEIYTLKFILSNIIPALMSLLVSNTFIGLQLQLVHLHYLKKLARITASINVCFGQSSVLIYTVWSDISTTLYPVILSYFSFFVTTPLEEMDPFNVSMTLLVRLLECSTLWISTDTCNAQRRTNHWPVYTKRPKYSELYFTHWWLFDLPETVTMAEHCQCYIGNRRNENVEVIA